MFLNVSLISDVGKSWELVFPQPTLSKKQLRNTRKLYRSIILQTNQGELHAQPRWCDRLISTEWGHLEHNLLYFHIVAM